MFNVNLFKNSLNTEWVGRHFWYFKKIASTNVYVKSKKYTETDHGLICLADVQSEGRGLYGKTWQTEPGQNLTFSLVLKPLPNNRLPIINLMAALTVTEVLFQQTGLSFWLKWPNDVYHENKKIGGLLTETSFTGSNLDRILLGIGLNINQKIFPEELKGKASSLVLITNKKEYSRETLLAQILFRLEQNYSLWEKKDEILIKRINRQMLGYGCWVKLQIDGAIPENPFKFLGINTSGLLHALNSDDEITIFTHEKVRIHQIIR
ncbi:MAG: biotin--[acetyl-CoA-carboxylase] ligase [Balneolales bacterium]